MFFDWPNDNLCTSINQSVDSLSMIPFSYVSLFSYRIFLYSCMQWMNLLSPLMAVLICPIEHGVKTNGFLSNRVLTSFLLQVEL